MFCFVLWQAKFMTTFANVSTHQVCIQVSWSNCLLFWGLPPVITVDFRVGEDVCCDIWFKPFLVGDVVKSLISAGMVGSSSLFLLSGLPLLSSPLSRICHRLRTMLVSYFLHRHLISYLFSRFSQKDRRRNKWWQYVLRNISPTMKYYANSICRYPTVQKKNILEGVCSNSWCQPGTFKFLVLPTLAIKDYISGGKYFLVGV